MNKREIIRAFGHGFSMENSIDKKALGLLFPTITTVVEMECCGVAGMIAILREQYAAGKVMAKIVSPRPKF